MHQLLNGTPFSTKWYIKLHKAIQKFKKNIQNNIKTLLWFYVIRRQREGGETFTASRELAIATRETFKKILLGSPSLVKNIILKLKQ